MSVGDLSLSIVYNPSLSCLMLFYDHPFISLYNLKNLSFTCTCTCIIHYVRMIHPCYYSVLGLSDGSTFAVELGPAVPISLLEGLLCWKE